MILCCIVIFFIIYYINKRNKVQVFIKENIRTYRLKVRTQDFHSCNRGSIPLKCTIIISNYSYNNYLVKICDSTINFVKLF